MKDDDIEGSSVFIQEETADVINFLRGLEIKDFDKFYEKPGVIQRRIQILTNIQFFLTNLADDFKIGGNELRETQRLALLSFYAWIKKSFINDTMLGHIILPMGSGKTNLAILLSEIVGGSTLFLTLSKNLGDQTKAAFDEHQKDKHPAFKKQAGQCYGGKFQTHADFIIAHYESSHIWEEKINWAKINMIIVDEADINCLSDKRASYIIKKAKSLGIPIVALSATEEQASGKKLETVFEDPIMQMRIPLALPHLNELGLVPDLQFADLYLDLDFKLRRKKAVKRDLPNEEIQKLFTDSEWNKKIINHYLENHPDKKGLVIFRNNLLVKDFITQSEKMGIKAAAFTGDQSASELDKLKSDFADGKIDILVGSKLIGRGLDIPEVDVVYNSLVTYSPQLFWQADGRGFRLDPKNKDKKVHVYAVLPRSLKEKGTDNEIPNEEKPLCHGAFFNPDYYEKNGLTNDISDKKSGHDYVRFDYKKVGNGIRSIEEVTKIIKEYYEILHPKQSRHQLVAFFIENCESFDITVLQKILNKKRLQLEKNISALFLDNNPVETKFSPDQNEILTKKEEKDLIYEYLMGKESPEKNLKQKSKKALDRLIKIYLPIIEALAKRIAEDEASADDLTYIGLGIFINKILNSYNPASKPSLLKYMSVSLYYHLIRASNKLKRICHIPVYLEDDINAMEKFIYKMKKINRNVNDDDIAEELDKPVKYIRKLKAVDTSLYIEPDPDSLSLSYEPDQIDKIIEEELKIETQRVLEIFTPIQKKIIRELYGINSDGSEHSFEDVAKKLNLSKETIRLIIVKSIRQLRHPSNSKRLRIFIEE